MLSTINLFGCYNYADAEECDLKIYEKISETIRCYLPGLPA